MSYASGSHPASTPFRTTIGTLLTSAGFTQVTANYASQTNWTMDVWKSPGTGNAAGQDWYLIVAESLVAGTRQPQLSVCEGWDDASKTATKYIPATNNVIPAADFSVGAGAVAPTNTNLFFATPGSWTDTSGVPYKISATLDRVVVQITTNTATYYGQIDKMYSNTTDPVALVAMALNSTGGATREPGQSVASASNFRVAALASAANAVLFATTWLTTADPITGKALLSPVVVSCLRAANTRRGLLKDLRGVSIAVTGADTATEVQFDGSTRTLWPVHTANGIFAAQL